MLVEDSVAKPKTSVKKLLTIGLFAGISVLALLFVARVIWKNSGSNQWELIGEKNGAKVYSLKEPGADLKQFKFVVRVHSSLSGVVKWLQDPDTCNDIGCYESKILERVDDQLQYVYFRFNLPRPFRVREYVLSVNVHQDPATGEVWVDFAAAPHKAPPNDCCFRVTHMNNTWKLTPLKNGEVEAEYVINVNEGGFIPDMLLNNGRPAYLFLQLAKLQGYLNREKYQTGKLDFIREE